MEKDSAIKTIDEYEQYHKELEREHGDIFDTVKKEIVKTLREKDVRFFEEFEDQDELEAFIEDYYSYLSDLEISIMLDNDAGNEKFHRRSEFWKPPRIMAHGYIRNDKEKYFSQDLLSELPLLVERYLKENKFQTNYFDWFFLALHVYAETSAFAVTLDNHSFLNRYLKNRLCNDCRLFHLQFFYK